MRWPRWRPPLDPRREPPSRNAAAAGPRAMPELPHRWCLTPLGQQTAAKNLGIAYLAARRHPGRGLTFDEKLSAAFMGLCNAAACYNPNRGTEFSTYAYWCAYDGI